VIAPSPEVDAPVGVTVDAGIVKAVVGAHVMVGVAKLIVIVTDWVPWA
jgi:hypothetical protein